MISIIIPSYNSEKTIKKCLDALVHQSYDEPYEMIVVDSSIDNTPGIVSSQYRRRVQMIHLDRKTDPGTARNIGIERAKGDPIAFIDADCVAARDWLTRMASAQGSRYRIVGGVVNNGNEKEDRVAWAGYLCEFRDFLPGRPRQEVMHVPTCNISYRRSVFDEFGRFNGAFYPQEDLVYNYNLWRKGERILFDPAIQVAHHHRSRPKDFLFHQKRTGAVTAKVLKVIPLEGALIVRNPFLAAWVIPILPIVKFIRTLFVFLKHHPDAIWKRPVVLAFFSLGLLSWVIGFAGGVSGKGFLMRNSR